MRIEGWRSGQSIRRRVRDSAPRIAVGLQASAGSEETADAANANLEELTAVSSANQVDGRSTRLSEMGGWHCAIDQGTLQRARAGLTAAVNWALLSRRSTWR